MRTKLTSSTDEYSNQTVPNSENGFGYWVWNKNSRNGGEEVCGRCRKKMKTKRIKKKDKSVILLSSRRMQTEITGYMKKLNRMLGCTKQFPIIKTKITKLRPVKPEISSGLRRHLGPTDTSPRNSYIGGTRLQT